MIPEFEPMTCRNCHYSELLTDGHGLITALECHQGVYKAMKYDIGCVMRCGLWSEKEYDDDE